MSKHSELMNSLRGMSQEQLVDYVNEARKQLFTLRLSSSTEHVKDNSQFKKLRRDIARAETCLRTHINN
jgi:ribosomal protein L29